MDNDNDLDMYLTNRPQDFYLGLSQMVAGKEPHLIMQEINCTETIMENLQRLENRRASITILVMHCL